MKYKSMIYRLLTFFTFFSIAVVSSAQDATGAKSTRGILDLLYENIILIIGAAVIIAAFAAIILLFNMMLRLQEMRMLQEKGIDVMEKEKSVEKESWLSAFYKKITGTVPLEEEEDILFDHEYDGIRELDNNLPPWWTAMFYITIVFAVVYLGYYQFSDYGLSPHEEYAQEMEYAEQSVLAYLAKQADQVDETNVEIVEDEVFIAAGKDIFDKNCVACHNPQGGGIKGLGPNLTDEYWLHGGGIKNVFKTIKYGVVEKGMQSWKEMLPPTAIHQVANYILTLQGTNPTNGLEPQGEVYKEEES
jgi:cytochrome c oxidase cbb3-type subunit 3